MNFAAIEAAVYQWVDASVPDGVTVIWDLPDAPRPQGSSIRLSFISGPTMIGHDEIRDVPESETAFRIVGPRSLVLSVTAYGTDCFQIISDLQNSLSDPDKRAILSTQNITVLNQTSIRDVTVALETKYERRAQLDFSMLVSEDITINPGVVEHVEVTASVEDITGTISVDKND